MLFIWRYLCKRRKQIVLTVLFTQLVAILFVCSTFFKIPNLRSENESLNVLNDTQKTVIPIAEYNRNNTLNDTQSIQFATDTKVSVTNNFSQSHQIVKPIYYPYKVVWICFVRAWYGTDVTKSKNPSHKSLGFAMEAINFIIPLCRMLPDNFGWTEEDDNHIDLWKKDPVWKGLRTADQKLLLRCFERGKNILKEATVANNPNLAYLGMIQYAPYDLEKIKKNYPQLNTFDHTFCRTMFETNSLPKDWDNFINKHVDEVWVPSHFEKDVFEKNGVTKTVSVIGEGFDPASLNITKAVDERHNLCPSCNPEDFIFLAVSKFEERKGYDHLVEAYYLEFGEDDNVCLALRASGLKRLVNLPEDNKKGLRMCYIPHLSSESFNNVYKSADAFVLATHGEGWGRTIMEAMAMGLPTLIPLWGGVTEYANETITVPIKVEGLEKPPLAWPLSDKANYEKHMWAKVHVPNIRQSLRWTYTHPDESKEIGKRAKRHVWENYTRDKVAQTAINRFQAVANQIGNRESRS